MWFDSLPSVNKCCCFSLRTGSIIIGVFGVFSNVGGHAQLFLLEKSDTFFYKFLRMYMFVFLISDIVLVVSSVLLIYGIYTSKPKLVTWWLYALLQNWLLLIFLNILLAYLYLSSNETSTPPQAYYWFCIFVEIFVWFYFMLVVNSHLTEIM